MSHVHVAGKRGAKLHSQVIFRWVLMLAALFSFARFTVAQSPNLAIVHVTVINPASEKPQPDMTILMQGHNIVSVAPAKDLKPPSSANVINGTGKFVIPGLWDMHTHSDDANTDFFCRHDVFSLSGLSTLR
jgi:predicted amidohydrolase